MRRLPVYLLLDVSGSMRGAPITAVNEGIKSLVSALRQDPYALETVYLSLITFNNTVEQTIPLTELCEFRAPELTAHLGTYIGKAIKFLSAKVKEEVVRTTPTSKGDWKPLVFMMSDGRSGDKVEKALTEFDKKQFASILICAMGETPNTDALKFISPNVVQMREVNQEGIRDFFKWVTASVATTSTRMAEGCPAPVIMDELPPLPPKINLVK